MDRHPTPQDAPSASLRRVAVLEARVARWPVWIDARRVIEVVARAAYAGLPGAPPGVRGILDHRGEAAVVVDLRERFGAPAPIGRWDPLVIVEGQTHDAGGRRWALVLDEVRDLAPLPEAVRVARDLPTERIAGLALASDGAALLVDPERLLDEHEIEQLRRALAERSAERDASP